MPTGGLDALAIGALIGAGTGAVEASTGHGKWLPDVLGGAVVGAATGGLAGPIGSAVGGEFGGLVGGVGAGALGGLADAAITGQKPGPAALFGGITGGIGAGLSGNISGGSGGLFGSGAPSAAAGLTSAAAPSGFDVSGGLGATGDLTSSGLGNLDPSALAISGGGGSLPVGGLTGVAPASVGSGDSLSGLIGPGGGGGQGSVLTGTIPVVGSPTGSGVGVPGGAPGTATPGSAIDPTKAAFSSFIDNPSFGGAGDVLKSTVTNHPLDILNAALLGKSALAQNNIPGMKQLEANAAIVSANSQAMQNALNGQLPPLAANALKAASNSAKASVRSYLAANGLGNSTIASSMEQAIDANMAQQTFAIADKLVAQGVDLASISSNMWASILQANTTQNNALMQSIASFSAGLVPAKLGKAA